MKQTIFITGTDTGVGKTLLTVLLVRFLREKGVSVAALKPTCSGGRDDARQLYEAQGRALSLDEINPWHFRKAVAPAVAARLEKRAVRLGSVLAHVRMVQRKYDVVLVEGAGGLLSPLGERFDSRDLLVALRASPVVVAPNRLGVVNHILLTLEALPKRLRQEAKVVLVAPAKPDPAAASNVDLLRRLLVPNVWQLPWHGEDRAAAALGPRLAWQLADRVGR